jgi:hypothetical protein
MDIKRSIGLSLACFSVFFLLVFLSSCGVTQICIRHLLRWSQKDRRCCFHHYALYILFLFCAMGALITGSFPKIHTPLNVRSHTSPRGVAERRIALAVFGLQVHDDWLSGVSLVATGHASEHRVDG